MKKLPAFFFILLLISIMIYEISKLPKEIYAVAGTLNVQSTIGTITSPIFYDAANSAYYLDPAGTNSLIVAGSVGIGTTGPGQLLHVNGSTRLAGTLASEAMYDPLNDGFVLHVPFAEGSGTALSDKSQNANNGTLNAGTWTTGKHGNAISFDGTASNYASFANSSSLQVGNKITIAFWGKKSAGSNYGAWVSKNLGTSTLGSGWYQVLNKLTSGITFRVAQDSDTLDSISTLSLNQWYHIVATYDGTTARIYLNGIQDASGVVSATPTNDTTSLFIGARTGGGVPNNAVMDDLRIYNRALTADEVRNLYNRGLDTQAPYVNLVSGNVGIGTTGPGYKLDVQGGIGTVAQFSGSVIVGNNLQADTINTAGITSTSGGIFSGDHIQIRSGYDLLLYSDAGTTLTSSIDGATGNTYFAGNVGIGTTGPTTALQVVGTITGTTKNFEIDHPTKPGMKLIHSTLEGPEVAVFYRGEAVLANGKTIVVLPEYFEALTRVEGRTVQLTAKNGWSPLSVDGDVSQGTFTVKGDSGNPSQQFFWEVKAVRKDVPPLQVEKSAN